MRNLIYTYRQQPEIGWSTVELLKQPNRAVLAHVCRESSGWAMVGLHNFGAEVASCPSSSPMYQGVPYSSISSVGFQNTSWTPQVESTSVSMLMAIGGCACGDRATSQSSEPARRRLT